MAKYIVIVPIVGVTYCSVEADSKDEAKEKAFDVCCNFNDENVQIGELYGVEHVYEGNCVNHPQWHMEVEEE